MLTLLLLLLLLHLRHCSTGYGAPSDGTSRDVLNDCSQSLCPTGVSFYSSVQVML
jgi:hypothetical protein